MKRRVFLMGTLATAGSVVGAAALLAPRRVGRIASWLRPPGAVSEGLFRATCIGCARCMEVCPNDCIRMLNGEVGVSRTRTPVIRPRTKGCILCMRCTEVCPTGALARIDAEAPKTRETVNMGLADLNKRVCFSYNGRTCGVCYRACPLQGKAMTIGMFERPEVHPEACVGCGLCENACVHLPQAIRVRDPRRKV